MSDGMHARARPSQNPEATAVVAVLSGQDRYLFPQLSGAPLPAGGGETVIKRQFTVGIYDLLGRFLPVALRVDVPYGTTGLYPTSRFLLFSAPSRRSLPGMAVFRGQVWDGVNGRPAAHAVVRIKLGRVELSLAADGSEEGAYYGVADYMGRVCVMFPLPPWIDGEPRSQEATVWVRYQGQELEPLANTAISLLAERDLPELGAITQQPPALIGVGDGRQPYLVVRLAEGRDTILRTPAPPVTDAVDVAQGWALLVYPT